MMDQGAEAIKRFRLKNAFGTELGECAWLRAALFAHWIGGDCENEAREVGVEGFVVLFYRRYQLVRSWLGEKRDRVRGSF